ncbi:hypothetical protein [Paractinoplanes atraurantiacus]|uniref:Uncharacterized protein n=1 Tax=Paractinoplanes atraurantiacus TaxID=1036182 RepID=A0A285H0R7_9ACTN|nr:hypothetical protein [Actinoplanes atraurantiacus]SNY29163.1 hypothetical protein SAMN05421748_103202 [Actinoplanes atraurantiacus]
MNDDLVSRNGLWWPSYQLFCRNRALLAERWHWPDGTLRACERLEAEHPDWRVMWLRENTCPDFERPACFWAVRRLDLDEEREVYAPDEAGLTAGIRATPPPRQWRAPRSIRPLPY